MVPTKTELQPGTYQFSQLEHCQVVADFSSAQITSDSGLVLIAQLDRHYCMIERFAKCFKGVSPDGVTRPLKPLL